MKTLLLSVMVLVSGAVGLAQPQPPPAPWRGAGPTPCVGSDGGVYKCAPTAPRMIAIRAGGLLDVNTGKILLNQYIVVLNDRITEIGSQSRMTLPIGTEIIDLGQATILPG